MILVVLSGKLAGYLVLEGSVESEAKQTARARLVEGKDHDGKTGNVGPVAGGKGLGLGSGLGLFSGAVSAGD